VTTVLDASVLIAAVEPTDAHHARAVQIMTASGAGGMAVHLLTLAEVLVGAVKNGVGPQVEAAVAAAGVVTVPGDTVSALAVATTRAVSGLKLPDAVVLATAQTLGADLATFDTTLAAQASAAGLVVIS